MLAEEFKRGQTVFSVNSGDFSIVRFDLSEAELMAIRIASLSLNFRAVPLVCRPRHASEDKHEDTGSPQTPNQWHLKFLL